MNEPSPTQYDPHTNAFKTLRDKIYIHEMPSYGNKIFYSLGFLSLTSLTILAVTGIMMAFMGPTWWLTSPWGVFFRSVHLWAVQAFLAILLCHVLVGFLTSAFKPPRRMIWVFGALMGCLALIQTEFGYGLRGDFASQYRAVSGADFWNGAYLGRWLNPLDYMQSFALHVVIIPLIIFLLFIAHYILIRAYGVALPYRKDAPQTMIPANHSILFIRGGALALLIVIFAFFFPSPYVAPVHIADIAHDDPELVMSTLLQEFEHTSDTATYLDSIDPYTFDTRRVYIVAPYEQSLVTSHAPDAWAAFQSESIDVQNADIQQAEEYATSTDTSLFASTTSPVITILITLMPMAQNGLYESMLDQENPSINSTYSLRFLNDMGVLDDKATTLNMNTAEWGMAKDDTGSVWRLPPGSWWFAPIGMVNSGFDLLNNPNGDRDVAEVLGFVMLLFILFPYIPYLNRLPEKLHLAWFIWK